MRYKSSSNIKPLLILVPIAGILVFLLLYFIAALYYPGGSDANYTAAGFSFMHNYWCDLMAAGAKNGQWNPARPIAISAMLLLCAALSIFWYLVPRLMNAGHYHYDFVQVTGITSMIFAIFVFTHYHDFIISIAVLLGVIALAGTYIALYRSRTYKTFLFGIFCLLLILLNLYIYYTCFYINLLALLQKITFLCYLLWITFIDLKLFFKQRSLTKTKH